MACIAKLQITNLVNGEKVTDLLPILQVKDANVTLNQLAEAILKLDKDSRTKIANALREARIQTLTEDDIKNHQFVSNTTLDSLQNEFKQLKEAFPNFQTDENLTIVRVNKIQLNGNNYFGRVVDATGKEIYIINGQYGAYKLFNYLDIKNKIKNALANNTLFEDLKEQYSQLKVIATKYKLSPEELLLNYIDDKRLYKPFKNENGDTIIPFKVLSSIYAKIANKYDSSKGRTDMQLLLNNVNIEESNRFKYRFNFNSLYNSLGLLVDNLPSRATWNSMSNDEIISYLKNIFALDPKLMKAHISIIGGDEKVEYELLEESDIKKIWSKFKVNNNDIDYETYGQLLKLAKIYPEQAKGKLQLAFPDAKITYFDNQFKVRQPIKKTKVVKLTQKQIEELWIQSQGNTSLKDTIKKNPKAVLSFFSNICDEVKIENGKVYASNKTTIIKSKQVVLTFPWTTLGEVYDFGYNSQYLFSPVNDDDVKNGKYHGAYIYQYKRDNTTHYAISRSYISPNSYAATYNSLDGAKAKIDEWNNTQIISENSLYTIKKYNYVPRTSFVEAKNLNAGQILTTLDIKLPNISRLTDVFYTAINGTVPQFKDIFKVIPKVSSIETPEQAAAFIYLFFNELKSQGGKNVQELIYQNIDKGNTIVEQILKAPVKSYFIENLNGKQATLKLLKDNGNDIDISGKFKNKNVNALSISDMENAIKYFNKKLGISIKTITQSELEEIAKKNKFKSNGVRAFILNGQIYINSSNANIQDLFHELTHIFLGTLKINDFNAYQRVINKYLKTKEFGRTKTYIDRAYQNFAEQDKIEECVADIIAEQLTQTQSLAETFKGEDFAEQFANIFDDFKEILTGNSNNGLAFNTILDDFNRNTRLTTFIQDNIQNGKIKEFGCQ